MEIFKGQKGSVALPLGKVSVPREELPEVIPRLRFRPQAIREYAEYNTPEVYSEYGRIPTRSSYYPVSAPGLDSKVYPASYPSSGGTNETFKYPVYIPKDLGQIGRAHV